MSRYFVGRFFAKYSNIWTLRKYTSSTLRFDPRKYAILAQIIAQKMYGQQSPCISDVSCDTHRTGPVVVSKDTHQDRRFVHEIITSPQVPPQMQQLPPAGAHPNAGLVPDRNY